MSFGVTINGVHAKSKKAIKEALVTKPESVVFYDTAFINPHRPVYGHQLSDVPFTIDFVGPDPYNSRKFYGTVKNGKLN